MNYKKIIKNAELRLKIISFFDWIPDKWMIKIQYRIKTGRKLNLKNPKRFTEKLQWYKLNYRNNLMTICSDKYLVREYVKSKGFGNILNDVYGVYDNISDIDFNVLPESFIVKLNNGSGYNYIVKNKNEENLNELRKMLKKWLGKKNIKYGREWCYYNIKSKIIIEKLLDRDENNDIPDYKFFCFNGKVEYLYVMIDYVDDHSKGKCSFYNRDFEKQPYKRSEYKEIDKEIIVPKNFNKMIEISEILSEGFPHVRVDFYNMNGKIIFGELTFYTASGYTVFTPDEFDIILGEKFKLL